MKREDPIDLLKQAIKIKEMEHVLAGISLKTDMNAIYESVKPINILKSTLKSLSGTPGIKAVILDATLGAATGYLSKKMIVRTSHNPLVKIVGSIFQFGISAFVTKNPGAIKLAGGYILRRMFQKKESVKEKTT